jgi:hypothetical protein
MPGETVEVTLQDASWIVVGQMIYAEGARAAGIFRVVGKGGNTITLLNPPPAPKGRAAIPKKDKQR